jgi:cephalosporin-C deacetylase
VLTDIIPQHKNGLFKDDDNIDYKIKVKSTYKEAQDGKLTYDILDG